MDEAIPQDDLVILEPEDCEYYQIPEGKLLIGRSDQFVSQGFVIIDEGKTIPKKAMAAPGTFKQIAGTCLVRTYDGDQVKETMLHTGNAMQIPENQEYDITSKSPACITYWRFDGDVYEHFTKTRERLSVVTPEAREKSGHKELFEEYQKRHEEKQGDR